MLLNDRKSDLGDQTNHSPILHQVVRICLSAPELTVPVLYSEESPLVKWTVDLEESDFLRVRMGGEIFFLFL